MLKISFMNKILLFITLFIISISSFAQHTNNDKGRIEVVTLGVGTGFSTFMGDIGTEGEVSPLANIRPLYFFNFERRFGKVLGAQIDASLGKISYNEHSKDILRNRNFESNTLQVGANLVLHFDNDVIIKRKTPFAPYVSAGFHYFKFDSYTDIKDKNGIIYQYWSDGTINDVVENDNDAPNATTLYRDYNYETKLEDPTTDYKRNSFAVPLTLGLKWKITPRFHGRFFGTYNIIFTDWVDNINDNSNGNDKNINVGFGLHYVLKMKDKERRHLYDDVDFAAISTADKDGDGVKDETDNCQNTPKGVEVNGFGCPLDKDNDGVADYLDEEDDSKKGAIVDEKGRTLTDEMIAKRKEALLAMVTERKSSFSESASGSTLDKIFDEIKKSKSSEGKIPPHLLEVDINNDGLISPKEVSNAMDNFFDGSGSLTVHSLHDLIDYFFEQ